MIYRREDVHQLGFSSPHDGVLNEPLVLTIDEFVEQLDLERLHARYSEAGTGYYDPAMMLKVWFFAYCDRNYHCRKVAERVRYDVRYRYFVGSHRPDFRTLNRFRKDHLDLLPDYFAALVNHCEQQGLLDSSIMALDGSKLRANASGRKLKQRALKREIGRRLQEDTEADEAGGASVKKTGSGGSAGKSISTTDPDARLMKTSEGTVRLCYNTQLVVDNNQWIVAADVGDNEDDHESLSPLLAQSERQLSSPMGAITFDKGYYSGLNLKRSQEAGYDIYVARPEKRSKVFGQDQFEYDEKHDRFRCPNGKWLKRSGEHRRYGIIKLKYASTAKHCHDCPLKTSCTHDRYRRLEVSEIFLYEHELAAKMNSESGQRVYARRRELVEPVFGNIKYNLGFSRFSLRGLARVKGEFLLICIAHNLKKLARCRNSRRLIVAFTSELGTIFACLKPIRAILNTFRTHKVKIAFG